MFTEILKKNPGFDRVIFSLKLNGLRGEWVIRDSLKMENLS
jgi:hypothetical protein